MREAFFLGEMIAPLVSIQNKSFYPSLDDVYKDVKRPFIHQVVNYWYHGLNVGFDYVISKITKMIIKVRIDIARFCKSIAQERALIC